MSSSTTTMSCQHCGNTYDPKNNTKTCKYHPGELVPDSSVAEVNDTGVYSCCQYRAPLKMQKYEVYAKHACSVRLHVALYALSLLFCMLGSVHAIHIRSMRQHALERSHEANLRDYAFAGVSFPTSGIQCHDDDALVKVLALMPDAPLVAANTDVKIVTRKYGQGDHYWPILSANNKKCYDVDIIYRANVGDILTSDDEYKSGCSIYRTKARDLQKLAKCFNDKVWKYASVAGESMLFRLISKIALESTDVNAYRTELNKVDRNTLSFVAGKLITHQTKFKAPHRSLLDRPGMITEMQKCLFVHPTQTDGITKAMANTNALLQREALVCFTVMMNAPGMLESGASEHANQIPGPITGAASIYDPGFNPLLFADKQEVSDDFTADWNTGANEVQQCQVHPTCARLAMQELRHWQHISYDKKSATHPNAYSQCTAWNTDKHRCRYHTRCWAEALKRVCKAKKKCCPTSAMHVTCQAITADMVYDVDTAGAAPAACHVCTIPQNKVDRDEWADSVTYAPKPVVSGANKAP